MEWNIELTGEVVFWVVVERIVAAPVVIQAVRVVGGYLGVPSVHEVGSSWWRWRGGIWREYRVLVAELHVVGYMVVVAFCKASSAIKLIGELVNVDALNQ